MGAVASGVIIIYIAECASSVLIGVVSSFRRHRFAPRSGPEGHAAVSADRRAIFASGSSFPSAIGRLFRRSSPDGQRPPGRAAPCA